MYIKGFIANLEKHLEGELIGEWVTFPISEEELNEVLKRIGVGENTMVILATMVLLSDFN